MAATRRANRLINKGARLGSNPFPEDGLPQVLTVNAALLRPSRKARSVGDEAREDRSPKPFCGFVALWGIFGMASIGYHAIK
jgi:hypothetical protein